MDKKERYSRQEDIVPADKIADIKATVIGVGAIGRQVALQLASIGIGELQLIDPDKVEESNVASQGYPENDVSHPKVVCTIGDCLCINEGLKWTTDEARWSRNLQEDVGTVVFCCVDSIDARRKIWNGIKDEVLFWVDGRMSAETMRIITAWDDASREYYPTTLFKATEAYTGSCTAKTTIYCANIAAGMMVSQFTKYLRGLPMDKDIQLNLLANELVLMDLMKEDQK